MAQSKFTPNDLFGQTFGRLKVIECLGINKNRARIWKCACSCGTIVEVIANSLKRGLTQSCGCLNKERITKHGLRYLPEYNIWHKMIARCENPNQPNFHLYGGRGIGVCDRWRESMANFYIDMGPRPSPKHKLERVNNNGPYCPENCIWVTAKEQARNRRSNRLITFGGATKSVTEWAEDLNVPRSRIYARLNMGWNIQDVLYKPGLR